MNGLQAKAAVLTQRLYTSMAVMNDAVLRGDRRTYEREVSYQVTLRGQKAQVDEEIIRRAEETARDRYMD